MLSSEEPKDWLPQNKQEDHAGDDHRQAIADDDGDGDLALSHLSAEALVVLDKEWHRPNRTFFDVDINPLLFHQ